MTVDELAKQLGIPYEGDGAIQIEEAAPLDSATAGQLAFVASTKAGAAALQSEACLIAPAIYPRPASQTVLRAENPRAVFAKALMLLYPAETARPSVHRTSCIEATATLDPTVEIGPHVVVGAYSLISIKQLARQNPICSVE